MICTYTQVTSPRPRKRIIGPLELKNGMKGIILDFDSKYRIGHPFKVENNRFYALANRPTDWDLPFIKSLTPTMFSFEVYI